MGLPSASAPEISIVDLHLPRCATVDLPPTGDPVAHAIEEIRRVTGGTRQSCSTREIETALNRLAATLAQLQAA